jgi:hypothetical protein
MRRSILFQTAVALAVAGLGIATTSWFLVVLGGGTAVALIFLRLWRRAPWAAPSAWSIFWIAGLIALGLVGLTIFGLAQGNAPLALRLWSLLGLLPSAFFFYLSWGAGYFAVTGRRHPSADQVGSVFKRGADIAGSDVWPRRRQK